MSVVLTLIAVLLGLLALLAVPFDLAFRVRGVERLQGQVAIRWLFGLVRFSVRHPDPARIERRQKREKPPPRVKRHGGGRANVLAMIRQQEFRRRVYRLLRHLVRAAHLQQLGLHLRVGLGDPADTGRLWALMGPLNAAAQQLRHANVYFEPEFIDPVLEFDAHGHMRLVPVQVLALLIVFALSPVSIRAWRRLRAGDA